MKNDLRNRGNFALNTEVISVVLSRISEADRKTRKHAPAKIKKLARSIAETGYFNPILVDENYQIIAGHARLAAAARLGMAMVPVIVLPGLSEAQKRGLRIADNQLAADAGWDHEMLVLELGDLIASGFEMELTGFDAIDLDRLLTPKPVAFPEDEEEAIVPPDTPVTRLGDIWRCGSHLLACGDARDDEIYQRLLWGKEADMVISDPPYNLEIPGNVSGLGKTKHDNFVAASGEMSDEEFSEFLVAVMTRLKAHTRDGSVHFLFIDWRHVADMINAGRQVFEALLSIVVWCKTNAGMGSFYRSQHELIAVFKNGQASPINNVQLGRMGRYRSNVWTFAGASSFSASRSEDLEAHPTVKPTALVAEAIRDVTVPGDLVLDPFGGSGTTMLAAESVDRRAVLIELDPKYCDVALERYLRFTGIEPLLLPHLQPWSAVMAERLGENHGR